MSLPKPPFDLVNHCSTVWNNTVYVYTPSGFQSLSLTQGAQWKTLPSGQSVTGGVCTSAMSAGNEALYIVGGAPAASSPDYPGLQRFKFGSGSWETITPVVPITQNRRNHGAQYINSTASILVYAGSTIDGDTTPSTQTFLISTAPPYSVLSFNSQGAPPLFAPIIMPWDEKHAVMVGGSADNKQVWTFGTEGWINLGTTLVNPITNQATTQCSIVTGDDSSKVLETYNLGVTPNTVTRYALWANGGPAPVGDVIGAPPSNRRRRDLTVQNWPAYNNSLAPEVARSAYSLAESNSGLVVITGGSSSDPIAIFDQRQNTWVNATSLLVAKNQVPLTTSSISSSTLLPTVSTVTPTITSQATASPTQTSAGAFGTGEPKNKVLTVLGGTLGAIFGLAAILVLILVLLRWKREKKKSTDRDVNEKDGRLSFADQGAEFMHEAGGSRGRAYSASLNSSVTSLQFFSKQGPKAGAKGHTRGMPSDSSQMGLVNGKSPLGANEPMEMSQMSQKPSPTFTTRSLDPKLDTLRPQANLAPIAIDAAAGTAASLAASDAATGPDSERSRSNGWSRYFANNDVTNLATMQQSGARSVYSTDAETFRSSMSRSEYGDPRNMSNSSVRPLELNLGPKFDGQRLSRVNTGSPTMGRSIEHMREGMSAEIQRAGSTSSLRSNPGDTYASTISTQPPTSTTWTPASNAGGWQHAPRTADTRSMGSNYSTDSNLFAPNDVGEYTSNNPIAGFLNSAKPRTAAPPPALPTLGLDLGRPTFGDVNRDSAGSAMTVFPSGIGANSPKLHAFPAKAQAAQLRSQPPGDDFDFPMPKAYFGESQRDSNASGMSNMTLFPRGVPSPTVSSFNKTNVAPPAATFHKPTMIDARRPGVPPVPEIPPSPARRGPVIRKTTGDEDMSWLNINAGKV